MEWQHGKLYFERQTEVKVKAQHQREAQTQSLTIMPMCLEDGVSSWRGATERRGTIHKIR